MLVSCLILVYFPVAEVFKKSAHTPRNIPLARGEISALWAQRNKISPDEHVQVPRGDAA